MTDTGRFRQRMELRERWFASERVGRLYEALVNEEDARACRDIGSEACRVVPGNFLLQIIAQFLTKLGDAIANPKTVLAWLLNALGAPGVFTALLVPIRESGSLVPQLVIASWVRHMPVRKWMFVLGSLLQGLAVLSIGLVAVTLSGTAAGLALIGALVVFSLARPEVMGRVLGIVYRCIATHLTKKAGFSPRTAQTGAVTLVQRFGSAL
ncbi:MAG: hypothetical protein JJT85_06425, partial [Chromatiales bacterium]|nr:hypothetical protein [Chromatiales bacterium]